MTLLINALIPIFFLILLGYLFKHLKFPHEDFWKYLDRFNYFVLFPSLLIYKLSTADISDISGSGFVFAAITALAILSAALIILNKFYSFESAAFTSIYQGAIRFNTYVFLALVDTLMGDRGLVMAAFLITFAIPVINLFCISIFSWYLPSSKTTFTSFAKSIFTNPLILACLFGGGLNFLNLHLPIVIESTLSILSMSALPLGLLSVGVGLHLSTIKEAKNELIISSVAKLIILPLLMLVIGNLFALSGGYIAILVLFGAMPTASSAYVLARELGGDLKLISSIISLQTIISILTIALFMQFIKI